MLRNLHLRNNIYKMRVCKFRLSLTLPNLLLHRTYRETTLPLLMVIFLSHLYLLITHYHYSPCRPYKSYYEHLIFLALLSFTNTTWSSYLITYTFIIGNLNREIYNSWNTYIIYFYLYWIINFPFFSQ